VNIKYVNAMTESLKVFFPEKKLEIEDIIIEIAHRLRRILGGQLVVVESIDGPDGENIKIIVREKNWETIDKIMEEIWRMKSRKA